MNLQRDASGIAVFNSEAAPGSRYGRNRRSIWRAFVAGTRGAASRAVAGIWKATASAGAAKTVFLLRFAQDMTLLEIAGATGLSENAVKVHLYRALRGGAHADGGSE